MINEKSGVANPAPEATDDLPVGEAMFDDQQDDDLHDATEADEVVEPVEAAENTSTDAVDEKYTALQAEIAALKSDKEHAEQSAATRMAESLRAEFEAERQADRDKNKADFEELEAIRAEKREAATKLSQEERDSLIDALGETAGLKAIEREEARNRKLLELESRQAQVTKPAPQLAKIEIKDGYSQESTDFQAYQSAYEVIAKSFKMTVNELMSSPAFKEKVANDKQYKLYEQAAYQVDNGRAVAVSKDKEVLSLLTGRITELLGAKTNPTGIVPQPQRGTHQPKLGISTSNGDEKSLGRDAIRDAFRTGNTSVLKSIEQRRQLTS